MKIVLVFSVIALNLKLVESVPLPQGTLPPSGQQANNVKYLVGAPITTIHGVPVSTPGIVPEVSLPTVPVQLTSAKKTINPHYLSTKQVPFEKPAALPVTGVQKQFFLQPGSIVNTASQNRIQVSNVPLQNHQNVRYVQTQVLNKQSTSPDIIQPIIASKASELKDDVHKDAVIDTSLHPENNKFIQIDDQKMFQNVHEPVQETVHVYLPVVKTQNQIITTPDHANIVQTQELKENKEKIINPVVTQKKNYVPVTVNTLQTKQPIQPAAVIVQTKTEPVLAHAQVKTTNLKSEQESLKLPESFQTKAAKPVENIVVKKVVQPQVIPVSASSSAPLPVSTQLPTIAPTFVEPISSTQNKQTILKINKSDPTSSAHAAGYAAKAAVKAANEAIFSSVSAAKAAQEAKDAAKAIEITAAELTSRSQALQLPTTEASTDATLTFSEKDADELAEIVVAAINRALKSIKIPISKLVPTKMTTNSGDEEFKNCHESDVKDNVPKSTKRKLTPRKSELIPDRIDHSSDSLSSVKSSKSSSLKAPKKLGFMSEPIYAYSPEAVDAAFGSFPEHLTDEDEEKEINEHNFGANDSKFGHTLDTYKFDSSEIESELKDEDDSDCQ